MQQIEKKKPLFAYWLLERLEEPPDRLDEGELTGMRPPRNICSCCSLIDPIRLCRSAPSSPPKSPRALEKLAAAAAAAAAAAPPPPPLAVDEAEPGTGL